MPGHFGKSSWTLHCLSARINHFQMSTHTRFLGFRTELIYSRFCFYIFINIGLICIIVCRCKDRMLTEIGLQDWIGLYFNFIDSNLKSFSNWNIYHFAQIRIFHFLLSYFIQLKIYMTHRIEYTLFTIYLGKFMLCKNYRLIKRLEFNISFFLNIIKIPLF